MSIKITMITYRTAKTLGDVMGAYRTVQALCKDLFTTVKVNFVITGETPELQGLRNSDGSFIVAAPNSKVDFKVNLFDRQEAAQAIPLGFKARGFFLNSALWTLEFLNNGMTRFFGIEKWIDYLADKMDDFVIGMSKKSIEIVLSGETGKYEELRAELMSSDLILVYNSPDLFLSILQVYSDHADLPLPQKVWFVSEYNGGDGNYQKVLQQVRSYPMPTGLQAKIIMTGFPDNQAPEVSVFGVFADKQESKKLTEHESNVLTELNYDPAKVEHIPGLFFGYTNYSTDKEGLDTYNSKINLEFFAAIAIKQYVAFHNNASQKRINIDIIAPFTRQQCKKIATQMQSENPHLMFQIISTTKDGALKVEPISDYDLTKEGIILVRLINVFPISPGLFKRFLEISEPLTIQTGDQSFIEAILNKKTPLFYQVMPWKCNYYFQFISFFHSCLLSNDLSSMDSSEYYERRVIISNFLACLTGTIDPNPNNTDFTKNSKIDAKLLELAELATNPKLFKHLMEALQTLANKIIQDLNAGDKLRATLQEVFPELMVPDQEEEGVGNQQGVKLMQLRASMDNHLLVQETTSAPTEKSATWTNQLSAGVLNINLERPQVRGRNVASSR